MMKTLKYILYSLGLASILLFCVSATSGIADAHAFVGRSFSEPINMIIFGIGLIGFGSFVKSRGIK